MSGRDLDRHDAEVIVDVGDRAVDAGRGDDLVPDLDVGLHLHLRPATLALRPDQQEVEDDPHEQERKERHDRVGLRLLGKDGEHADLR